MIPASAIQNDEPFELRLVLPRAGAMGAVLERVLRLVERRCVDVEDLVVVALHVDDHERQEAEEEHRREVREDPRLEALAGHLPLPRLDQEPVRGDGDREHEHDQEERERVADVARRRLGLGLVAEPAAARERHHGEQRQERHGDDRQLDTARGVLLLRLHRPNLDVLRRCELLGER